MRTVAIFKNGGNQAVRLPREFGYENVNKLEIEKIGEEIILRPYRPNWLSFGEYEKADDDFMNKKSSDFIVNERRLNFD